MNGIKIAVIGAGSSYTPELIEGLIDRCNSISLERITFYDIDERRLDILFHLSRRMIEASGKAIRIAKSMNLAKAVSGADFIVNQIRVGGQRGRIFDERLGISLGIIGQETIGIGGFSKAMRTIPTVLDQCKIYQKYARCSILINFTNPSGLITEAIMRYAGLNCIGLCNIPINLKMDIASYFNIDPSTVELDYIGLNHLGWVRSIKMGRKTIRLDKIRETISDFSPKNIPDMDYPERLLSAIGAFPNYYLRYFYLNREMIKRQMKAGLTRGEEVLRIENQLLKIYQDKKLYRKPELLSKRGGAYYSKAATDLIDSIVNNRKKIEVVNIPAGGKIDGFEPEEVLEVPSMIDKGGAVPLENKIDDIHMFSLVRMIKGYERLTIQAAVERSFNKAVNALITHPLIMDAELAMRAVDKINKRFKLNLH